LIKTIVKLAVVALLANAVWRIGSAYISFYRFQDAVSEAVLHSKGKTENELKDKVIELAASYDEPMTVDAISIRREDPHTIIEGAYKKPVLLAPGIEYEWPFNLSVDALVLVPVKLGDSTNP
jgi:hypothetical protein